MRSRVAALICAALLIHPALAFAADSDLTKEHAYWGAINSVDFQNRSALQFAIAAISVTSEVATQNTNAATASGNATLHFSSAPSINVAGYTVVDLTTAAAIPANTTIISGGTTATPVMSTGAGTVGVASGDLISFAPPNHTARQALAGQILAGSISGQQLALWVLTNSTIQTEVVSDFDASSPVGTSVTDAQIATAVSSVLTGLATSLPSTATSTI